MRYVSLHTHSTFSYGDGFGPVLYHVDRVAALGMKALALTEHGNVSSWVQLEIACASTLGAVKPIFGLEAYVAPENQPRKCHMILLAMNEEGLRNLNHLVTLSYLTLGKTSKSKFPTIHPYMLRENNRGLIVLSGCADSQLSCVLLGGKSYGDKRVELRNRDIDAGVRLVEQYQAIFGDRYYLETQRFSGLERTCLLNPALQEISRRTGARLCATSDVHYPYPNENAMQRILHAASRGGKSIDAADAEWEYDILLTYPTSDKEIYQNLCDTGLSPAKAKEAILSTETIASRCDVVLPKAPPPRYIINSQRDWAQW